MSRVTELEAAQAEDRVALSRANTAMTRTGTFYNIVAVEYILEQ